MKKINAKNKDFVANLSTFWIKFFNYSNEYDKILDECANDLYLQTNLKQQFKNAQTRDSGRDFIIQIILNTFVLTEKGAEAIVFPKANGHWVPTQPNNPRQYTHTIVSSLNRLDRREFITIYRGNSRTQLPWMEKSGVCSLFIPQPKFIKLVNSYLKGKVDIKNIRPQMNPIYVNKVWKESLGHKTIKKKKTIKYNNYEGHVVLSDLNNITIPFSSSEQAKFITDYNSFISSFNFSMDVLTPEQQEGFNQCCLENGDSFYFPWLRRIFNCGTDSLNHFSWGGRWFGHWIQNLWQKKLDCKEQPYKLRKKVLIDGQKTVELDYSAYHANILYAIEGIKPHFDDAYEVPFHGHNRAYSKKAMLIVFNAEDYNEAFGALKANIKQLKNVNDASQGYRYPIMDHEIEFILDELKHIHAPIKKYFYSGSGRSMQCLDSYIATRILSKCMKLGKPCIPIHDSFLMKVEDKEFLHDLMLSEFQSVLNTTNVIKIG